MNAFLLAGKFLLWPVCNVVFHGIDLTLNLRIASVLGAVSWKNSKFMVLLVVF